MNVCDCHFTVAFLPSAFAFKPWQLPGPYLPLTCMDTCLSACACMSTPLYQFLTAIIPPALFGYICVLPYWWHILQICFWIIIFWSLPQHINIKSSSTVVSGMSLLSVTVIKTLQYERMSCCAVNLTTHHQHFITSQHYIDISVHWLYRCQVKSPHPEVLSSFLWHHVLLRVTVIDYFMLA